MSNVEVRDTSIFDIQDSLFDIEKPLQGFGAVLNHPSILSL
jgi:hypothetical protein